MFKSEAQRQRLKKMVEEGKFPKEAYDEWESKSGKNLPARNASYSPKEKRGKYTKRPK